MKVKQSVGEEFVEHRLLSRQNSVNPVALSRPLIMEGVDNCEYCFGGIRHPPNGGFVGHKAV
ncbi:hypothetical protein C2845_PM01G25620 [Panicum miliaceum]|uniref:Uncharacterized protein n=1 Tax=Panicum miliaceum TaxID=4540 RepID=A0A3L6TRE5_PANMI|nr:hypothetical protein C2845_PM01G25620 [Panicum miliaceum]